MPSTLLPEVEEVAKTEDGDVNNVVKCSQTDFCTVLASMHYTANNETALSDAVGIDSQRFDMAWVEPDNLVDKVVHLNLQGRVNGATKNFFVELVGPDYPDFMVRRLVEYGPEDSTHNCPFCTGLWHPMAGDFHGHRKSRSRCRCRP